MKHHPPTPAVKPLRAWLREMSATRRAARALKAKYGETVRSGRARPEYRLYIEPVPDQTKRRKPKRPKYQSITTMRDEVAEEFHAARKARNDARRTMLVLAQGNCCYLCGLTFTETAPPTLEHVRPRAQGGRSAGNILAAHGRCNQLKADRSPTAHEMAYLRTINARLQE